jgi:hypothetical protein
MRWKRSSVKSQVFVLVPYDVPPAEIGEFERLLLEKHRFDPDDPSSRGRYDYLVGALEKSFNDPVAEGRLPPKVRRTYSGNICERANLPADLVPAALVTPDGEWHDLADFGWKMVKEPSDENRAARAHWEIRYRELIAAHHNCWVVEVWAHS